MTAEKFFNECVDGLVSMLVEFAYEKYGELYKGARYVLWSNSSGGIHYINVAYRKLGIKLAVGETGLLLVGLNNIDESQGDRVVSVVEDCVYKLSGYPRDIRKVEGLLTHQEGRIRVIEASIEPGSIDVYIGV